MTKDDENNAASKGLTPASPQTASEQCLPTALVPLVRLLARQVAREWEKQAANDNRPAEPERERPDKE